MSFNRTKVSGNVWFWYCFIDRYLNNEVRLQNVKIPGQTPPGSLKSVLNGLRAIPFEILRMAGREN